MYIILLMMTHQVAIKDRYKNHYKDHFKIMTFDVTAGVMHSYPMYPDVPRHDQIVMSHQQPPRQWDTYTWYGMITWDTDLWDTYLWHTYEYIPGLMAYPVAIPVVWSRHGVMGWNVVMVWDEALHEMRRDIHGLISHEAWHDMRRDGLNRHGVTSHEAWHEIRWDGSSLGQG